MSTPDLPDWTTSVAGLETTTFLGASGGVASGSSLGPFDTSQLAAVSIGLSNANATIGGLAMLILHWTDQAGSWDLYETLTMHTMASYDIGVVGLRWLCPVRGPSLTLSPLTSPAFSTSLIVGGTTRGDPEALTFTTAGTPSRLLLDTGVAAVPAGAFGAVHYLPPVAGKVNIRAAATVATAPLGIVVNGVGVQAAALQSSRIASASGTGEANLLGLPVPRIGLELFVQNNDTVARNIRLTAWDAS